MSKYTLLAFAALALGAAAQAGSEKPAGIASTRGLDWNQFKESCTNPAAFQSQRPPENIRIQCSEVSHCFVPAPQGNVPLPENRNVKTAVFSDKYHVQSEESAVPVQSSLGACPSFKEVERTMSLERAVTCDEILAYKGELKDFCTTSLDEAKASNPKLMSESDTGRTIDTCAAASVQSAKASNKQDGSSSVR